MQTVIFSVLVVIVYASYLLLQSSLASNEAQAYRIENQVEKEHPEKGRLAGQGMPAHISATPAGACWR